MCLSVSLPFEIGGYVLAGGRSSRMGRDKALIPLAGQPLIEHAVAKMRRISGDVHILSNDPALAAFAPSVPDIHPNCGPIGGIEAALTHTTHDWNLFLPVDMPLLPAALLAQWAGDVLNAGASQRPGIRIFTGNGRPQPGLCLLHKAVLPHIARAIQREEFALISVFEEVGREACWDFIQSTSSNELLNAAVIGESRPAVSAAQLAARALWFLNVNTKQDLAVAEANIAALDT